MTLAPSSQQKADAAKTQLDGDLKAIAPVDAEGVAAIEHDVDALWELAQKAADAYYSSDDSAGGNALMAQAQSHILSVNNEIEQIVDRVERQSLLRRDASMRDARRAVDLSITGGIIALTVALIVTALIVRSINAPLRRLERSMNAITQGRLDVPIPTAGPDEIGGMTRALAMLRDSLVESRRLEQERQRAEAEARRAQAQLGEAIEAISEGFALYDADDRLVICNRRFREMYASVGLEIQPGTQYETILRAAAGTGIIPAASDRTDAWVAERLDRHRNPGVPSNSSAAAAGGSRSASGGQRMGASSACSPTSPSLRIASCSSGSWSTGWPRRATRRWRRRSPRAGFSPI